MELLKYLNKSEIVSAFDKWSMPAPPLSGQFLKEQKCPDGMVMGKVRQILVDKWIDSRFVLTQEDLGELIPEILVSLKEFIAENDKKQSGKRKRVSVAKN